VRWVLAPVLVELGKQLDKLGITWYSIGDGNHLKKAGGHTPWKSGTDGHTVTAIDVMKSGYAAVDAALLRVMRSNTDTTWIDFTNSNYIQRDWNGRVQGPSGDGHLHLEVLASKVGVAAPPLFYEMFGYPVGVVKVPPAKAPVLTPPAPPTAPTPTVPFWEADMIKIVKLRSADAVYVQRPDGKLQHVSKAQLTVAQTFNLKMLPAGASEKDKAKVTEPFVAENEAALALFGTAIVSLTDQVEGL
jgi:hypothetical protein